MVIKHATCFVRRLILLFTLAVMFLTGRSLSVQEPDQRTVKTNPRLKNGLTPEDIRTEDYLQYVQAALDTLIKNGTDRYGSKQSDALLVSVLDVRRKKAIRESAGDKWRVDRIKRRNPGAADLANDQALIRTMDRISELTGNEKYTRFADRYISYATNHLVAENDDSFWWGWHRRYDVFEDKKHGHSGGHHELHAVDTINWDRLYDVNPDATLAEVKHIWKKHVVNKQTGEINRHDTGNAGLSFIISSGAFIQAFAWTYSVTGNQKWLKRANLLMNYNTQRTSDAGLLADAPNQSSRWDGKRSLTTFPGLYSGSLITAHHITDEDLFQKRAVRHLKDWYQHAYDPETHQFWGSLKMDGTPVKGPRATSGYKQYEPRGQVDLWNPYVLGYEHPLPAARSFVRGAKMTRDETLLEASKKWASFIKKNLPPTSTRISTWYDGYSTNWAPYGTYAKHYGHVIFFFLDLYRITDNEQYHRTAKQLANHAIAHLWYDGLFRGHPKKPYYEAVDGVGLFMEALTELGALHRSR